MAETTQAPTVAACSKCNVALVPIKRTPRVSIAGIFGVLLFLIGAVIALLWNITMGLVLVVLAILISFAGRSSFIQMTCPACGATGAKL